MFELNRRQKNQLFEVVRQNSLDTSLFSWVVRYSNINQNWDGSGCEVEALSTTIDGKMFYFTFEQDGFDNFLSSMRPPISEGSSALTKHWSGVLSNFTEWLTIIKYEMEEPDLWKNPPAEPAFATPSNYTQDVKFAELEREHLSAVLRDIKSRVESMVVMNSPQKVKLEQTFIYLEQKLESSSKIDWRNILIGTFVSLMAEPWFAPAASTLREIVLEKFTPFFQHLLN